MAQLLTLKMKHWGKLSRSETQLHFLPEPTCQNRDGPYYCHPGSLKRSWRNLRIFFFKVQIIVLALLMCFLIFSYLFLISLALTSRLQQLKLLTAVLFSKHSIEVCLWVMHRHTLQPVRLKCTWGSLRPVWMVPLLFKVSRSKQQSVIYCYSQLPFLICIFSDLHLITLKIPTWEFLKCSFKLKKIKIH